MDRPAGDDRQFATPLRYLCAKCNKPQHLLVQHPWWVCPDCQTRFVPADLQALPDDTRAHPSPPKPAATTAASLQ